MTKSYANSLSPQGGVPEAPIWDMSCALVIVGLCVLTCAVAASFCYIAFHEALARVLKSPQTIVPAEKKFRPYVPETMEMKEFTFRAVLIGLFLTALLGSANAYLGLKAGMTIAAPSPAAVISMALLRLMKGSLLEENIGRTVGSIGESVAAGAVFTIPAFVMAGLWPGLTKDQYWKSVALMMICGTPGNFFVTP